jgi:beta-N-acetylhexosaminidase
MWSFRRPARGALVAVVAAASTVAGCAGGRAADRAAERTSSSAPVASSPSAASTGASTTTAPSSPTSATAAPEPPAATPSDPAEATLARMSLSQRVGQLLMVGTPATSASASTLRAITRYHVGNAMLTGRSSAGVAATARVSAALQRRATTSATARVRLHVATDQEGGRVQVLRGRGFSTMPTALRQGSWSTSTLQSRARTWGRQLHAAGVTMNLAPVADTVPSASFAPRNAPIGAFSRQYGYTTSRVGSHVVAFDRGMGAARVQVSVKHFPGLGRVTKNTDTTAGVTDRTTTRGDAYLRPFAAAVDAGAPVVMMSTAVYSRIDPKAPAAFSRTVVTGVLRGDLGFRGVVISDDLGNARQVRRWTPGQRATRFVAAGGDLVLTVNPATARAMFAALRDRARTDAAFRKAVDAAALRVLRSKQAQGLLPRG